MFLGNRKIRVRLIGGFGIVLALMLVMVFMGLYSLDGIQKRLDNIVSNDNARVGLAVNMMDAMRERSIVIRNMMLMMQMKDSEAVERDYKRFEEQAIKYKENKSKLEKMEISVTGRELLTKLTGLENDTLPIADKAAQLTRADNVSGALDVLLTDFRPRQKDWLDTLQALVAYQNSEIIQSAQAARKAYNHAKLLLLTLGAAALVLGIVIARSIGLSIVGPLTEGVRLADQIAEGDLSVRVEVHGQDETGNLLEALNKMARSFVGIIQGVLSSSDRVVSAVKVLQSGMYKTAEGARNQSSQASLIAAASQEMSQTVTDIAKNASVASDTSAEAMKIVESGKQITNTAVETINEVNESTAELAGMVEKLDNRVVEIGGILTVIKDIADQTNLLALNAAIEAARAGEQGRGFAVVADEVRKLAEKTIKATTEISERINAVQAESEQTTKSMEKSSTGVARATGHIRNLNNVLETIVESVQQVRDQITQIASAAEEQSAASEEVTQNIEKTSAIARDIEKMSGDVMSEVEGLAKTASELINCTSRFKI